MNKLMMVATIVIAIAAQMPPTTAQLYTLQANAGPGADHCGDALDAASACRSKQSMPLR